MVWSCFSAIWLAISGLYRQILRDNVKRSNKLKLIKRWLMWHDPKDRSQPYQRTVKAGNNRRGLCSRLSLTCLTIWETTLSWQIWVFFFFDVVPTANRQTELIPWAMWWTSGSTAALWTIITHNMLQSLNTLQHSFESYLLPKVTSTAQWTCSTLLSFSCLLKDDVPSQPQKRR